MARDCTRASKALLAKSLVAIDLNHSLLYVTKVFSINFTELLKRNLIRPNNLVELLTSYGEMAPTIHTYMKEMKTMLSYFEERPDVLRGGILLLSCTPSIVCGRNF